MAGTVEGGKKAAAANLANNPNFYAEIGAKGGSRKTPDGGFGANKALARQVGAIGGRRSMRGYKLSVIRKGVLYYKNLKTNRIEKFYEDTDGKVRKLES